MIFEIFPEEYIQLNKELASGFHPTLEAIINRCGPDEIDVKLAQCAAYTGIGLDDFYTIDERRKLCELIRQRLVTMRIDPTPQIILQ